MKRRVFAALLIGSAVGGGARLLAAETGAEVSVAASNAAVSTPTFASSSSAPSKARSAIRIETVNPIPARVPAAATEAQPTGGRRRPRLTVVASQLAPATPIADGVRRFVSWYRAYRKV